MAVRKKGQKTKRKIFNTAMKLFKEKGYDNVTVDEIVAGAEIAKGTFYNYFPTKAHVVAEIFTELDIDYENIMEQMKDIDSSLEKLRRLLRSSVEIQQTYIGYDLSVIGYRAQLELHTEYSMDADRPLYKYMTELIREGQEKGEMNTDARPEYYARILVRCIRGAIYEWCVSCNNYDFIDDGNEYLEHLFKVLQ